MHRWLWLTKYFSVYSVFTTNVYPRLILSAFFYAGVAFLLCTAREKSKTEAIRYIYQLSISSVSTIGRRWSKRRCLIYASARRSNVYIRKQQKGFMTNPNPNLTLT